MLGYKFINIKIQIALMKQIIFSYLFNLFISSPNFFFKPLLLNFSKDSLDKNSKEQINNFIANNNDIFKSFINSLDAKSKKYMFLTVILNKQMKTNFDNLSDVEIEEVGSSELKNLFFDVFFEFIERIKNEFKIDLDLIIEKISENGNPVKNDIESFFKSSKIIPSFVDANKAALRPTINYETLENINEAEKFKNLLNSKDLGEITDNNILFIFGGSYGLSSEFYYKIKESLNVNLYCGSESRKNIIAFSIRDLLKETGKEFLAVQQFFNWNLDNSYEGFDQFIFYRNEDVKKIISSDDEQMHKYDVSFNSEQYTGAKFLTKQEILNLKNNLKNTNNNEGFLAIIPNRIFQEKEIAEINNLLNNLNENLKLYISVFSKSEKDLKLSFMDIVNLLGTTKDGIANSKTIVYKKDSFNINELFDLYFDITSSSYFLQEYKTDTVVLSYGNISLDPIDELIQKENLKDVKKEMIQNKVGMFVLKIPEITQLYSQDNIYKYNSGDTENIFYRYFLEDRKTLLSLKLSMNNEEKFSFASGFLGVDEESLSLSEIRTINKSIATFSKTNFYNKFMFFAEDVRFKEFVNALFPSELLTDKIMIEKLNFGTINDQFSNDLKSLRSYKNFQDFINYYNNIVEVLAKEAVDRV